MCEDLKKDAIQQASQQISLLCQSRNQALAAISVLMTAKAATEKAILDLQNRILRDNDAQAAYYLIILSQQMADSPLDMRELIRLVLMQGKEMRQKLLNKISAQMRKSLDDDEEFSCLLIKDGNT